MLRSVAQPYSVSIRTYFSKDYRPDSRHKGWFSALGLAKSQYPRSHVERQPGVDKNLQERIDDMYSEDRHKLATREDIGFPPIKPDDPTTNRKKMIAWRREQRKNPALEKAARERTLKVDTTIVTNDHIQSGGIFKDIYDAAELYGIYEDLFPGCIFHPTTMLTLEYSVEGTDQVLPVYRGNVIKPRQALNQPRVLFQPHDNDDSLYTLVMTTPDGHFHDDTKEYLHWMVGNIGKANSAGKDTICEYMRPFPPFGTGYFRYVFVLYKQKGKLDFSDEKIASSSRPDLNERTFSSAEFMDKYRDQLTPTGLAFFQCDYDSTVRQFFHDVLDLPEPRFEYDFLPNYVRSWNQLHFSNADDGFNLFLDKHRDPKDIQEEILVKKLKEFHPFKGDLRTKRYPLAHKPEIIGEHPYEGYWHQPTWRLREIEREHLRQGIYKDMDWKKMRNDPSDSYA